MPSLVGSSMRPAPVADAAKRLRHRGFQDLEIYAPAAFPELDDALDRKAERGADLDPDRRACSAS